MSPLDRLAGRMDEASRWSRRHSLTQPEWWCPGCGLWHVDDCPGGAPSRATFSPVRMGRRPCVETPGYLLALDDAARRDARQSA